MNTPSLLCLAIGSAALSISCSTGGSHSSGFAASQSMRVLEDRRYQNEAGATFRTQTFLLSESPRETITQVVQVSPAQVTR
ncbi:MAG: hypothetical protein KDK99_04710 [Verrucomicrobiales bacterium]|nr:hypothetical protein [Verrucomicrobiales bacterium]